MNLPTTNLLEWIDERIDVLNDLIEDCKSMEERERIGIRLYEISGMRDRILQERENEKQFGDRCFTAGCAAQVKENYSGKKIPPPQTNMDFETFYTTTFNPNNDER